jgi:hypothetical protein
LGFTFSLCRYTAANDHDRLAVAVAREAAALDARSSILGGGQLCFRGGEVSESSVYTDEYEAGPPAHVDSP